jgi:hypothetical protein
MGYRTTANNDYSVALGYRARDNSHTGTMCDAVKTHPPTRCAAQADREFRIRYTAASACG